MNYYFTLFLILSVAIEPKILFAFSFDVCLPKTNKEITNLGILTRILNICFPFVQPCILNLFCSKQINTEFDRSLAEMVFGNLKNKFVKIMSIGRFD